MVGIWDWKAVQLHFSIYRSLSSFPLKWNEQTKLFSFDFKRPLMYWAWYFNFFIVLGLGSTSCMAGVLIFKRDIPIFMKLMFVIVILVIISILVCSLFILKYGHPTANCLNALIHIQQELTSWQRPKTESTRKSRERVQTKKQNQLQMNIKYILSLLKERFLYMSVISLETLRLVFMILTEIIGINPLSIMVDDILENRIDIKLSFIAFVVLRITCTFVLWFWLAEGFRIAELFVVLFLSLPTQMWVENIQLMRQVFSKNVNSDLYLKRIYMSFIKSRITQTVSSEFAEPEIAFLIKLLIRFIPLLLFLTVRMHSIFPLELYLPIALIAVPVVIIASVFLLSITVGVFTDSLENITSWKRAINPYSKKELYKMYKTLRPLGWQAGIGGFKFEIIDDNFKRDILMKVQDQTVELLLLFPENMFI